MTLRNIHDRFKALPRRVRQILAGVIGSTLVVVGLALVVLPGPFTVPLLIGGLAVLGTEFVWARRLLGRVSRLDLFRGRFRRR